MTSGSSATQGESVWGLPCDSNVFDKWAYESTHDSRRRFNIKSYDPDWAQQFQAIKCDLEADLAESDVTYLRIEHIGSTSVPGLGSKATTDPSSGIFEDAVIDICIVVTRLDFNEAKLKEFEYALLWGLRQGGYFFIGDGGVEDRWSFKLRGIAPLRNLYVVAEDSIPLRAYISLREVLKVDEALRREYEDVKRKLAAEYDDNILAYCNSKRPTIRKIFLKGGWTHEEVDVAERQAQREWDPYTPADYWQRYDDSFDELGVGGGEDAVLKNPPKVT